MIITANMHKAAGKENGRGLEDRARLVGFCRCLFGGFKKNRRCVHHFEIDMIGELVEIVAEHG